MRYWIEERYRIECSRAEAERLFGAFPEWAATNRVADTVDDLDMAVTFGPGWHELQFSCSLPATGRTRPVEPSFDVWTDRVGLAARSANIVAFAFLVGHDEGAWRLRHGRTTVTSSADADTVEHPTLSMTVHHSDADLREYTTNPGK